MRLPYTRGPLLHFQRKFNAGASVKRSTFNFIINDVIISRNNGTCIRNVMGAIYYYWHYETWTFILKLMVDLKNEVMNLYTYYQRAKENLMKLKIKQSKSDRAKNKNASKTRRTKNRNAEKELKRKTIHEGTTIVPTWLEGVLRTTRRLQGAPPIRTHCVAAENVLKSSKRNHFQCAMTFIKPCPFHSSKCVAEMISGPGRMICYHIRQSTK